MQAALVIRLGNFRFPDLGKRLFLGHEGGKVFPILVPSPQ